MKKRLSFFFQLNVKWWVHGLIIFFVLLLAAVSALQTYAWLQRDKIYPGVKVGSFPMGGLTQAQAEETLQATIEPIRGQGLIFSWRNRTITVPNIVSATADPDLAYEVISYDLAKTVQRLKSFGRQGSFLAVWRDRLSALMGQAEIEPIFSWRQDKALDILKSNLSSLEEPGQNAGFLIQDQEVTVEPERVGLVFDYEAAISEAEGQLLNLIFKPIALSLKQEAPTITSSYVNALLPAAQAFLAGSDVTVNYASSTWPLKRGQLAETLEPRFGGNGGQEVILGLAQDKLSELLLPARQAIDIPAQEPKFRLAGSKAVEFQASVIGREVDIEATRKLWEQEIINKGAAELSVVVSEKQPAKQVADLNNLGIKELLGVGKSNFKGSPRNRRHNIAIGAAAANGTLIAPGEEFSLLKTLGKVDAAAGYLPELVIKGNKTVPEYGGGLCQIGTTTFRGTLAAGLPVTERQNHSYTVSYYFNEKGLPGTDATIYDPRPDYRFKNDTANYVLIITRIEGDIIFFEYWGTKDGRQVEQSDVRVWDRIGAGPTKLIETLDLKPGEKKCTETAHAGIKAAFDYKIAYPDGQVAATTFTSQYRPWPEVCLIGVEKLSTEEEATENGADAASPEPAPLPETEPENPPVVAPEDASAAIIN